MPVDPDHSRSFFELIGVGVGSLIAGVGSVLGIKRVQERREEETVLAAVKADLGATRQMVRTEVDKVHTLMLNHDRTEAIFQSNVTGAQTRLANEIDKLQDSINRLREAIVERFPKVP